MASLLPLLHDLLPMFMPSKVQITRSSDLPPVEERAEILPWYQQKPRADAPRAESGPPKTEMDVEADDSEETALSELDSAISEPIRLLDHEEHHVALGGTSKAEPAVAGSPIIIDTGASVSSQHQGGPKVFRRNAMVGMSDNMCVTVLTVQPRSASAIHHHGEQDVIIYATTPGVLLTSPTLDPVKALRADFKGDLPTSEEDQPCRFELGPGDCAFIPAWTEHQVVNEGSESDVSWVLFRGGGEPLQVDLDGWGGSRIKR